MNEIIYRCPKNCPWNKQCFICKVQGEINGELVILHKCDVKKRTSLFALKKGRQLYKGIACKDSHLDVLILQYSGFMFE